MPIVVVDLRVALFRILDRLDKATGDYFKRTGEMLEGQKRENWVRAQWAILFSKPMAFCKYAPLNCQLVVVDDFRNKDTNCYWRSAYYEPYKANRNTQRSEGYSYVLEMGRQYLASPGCKIPVYRQENFEADDWAGAIFRWRAKQYKHDPIKANRDILMLTSDYDWQQLISDTLMVRWANSYLHKPRLRSEYEMLKVHEDRGISFEKPYDIVAHKARWGDVSDNIGENAPICIIDLRDPPHKPDSEELEAFLDTEATNTVAKHYSSACAWLTQNGFVGLTY